MICKFLEHIPAPKCVLTVHSAKALMVESNKVPNVILADSIIQLAVAKGTRHEASCVMDINHC